MRNKNYIKSVLDYIQNNRHMWNQRIMYHKNIHGNVQYCFGGIAAMLTGMTHSEIKANGGYRRIAKAQLGFDDKECGYYFKADRTFEELKTSLN